MDKLLLRIEKGDSGEILSEKDFYPKFNELLKYGLVEVKGEKILLTAKGIEAKKIGVNLVIKKIKHHQYLKEQTREELSLKETRKVLEEPQRKNYFGKWFWLLLISLLPLLVKFASRIWGKFINKNSQKQNIIQ